MNRPLALQENDPMADEPPRDQKLNGAAPESAATDPITRCLRLVYAEVVAEPIPDELMRLLQELDDKVPGAPDG